jgi:hypothetical protein
MPIKVRIEQMARISAKIKFKLHDKTHKKPHLCYSEKTDSYNLPLFSWKKKNAVRA